jgi:hypothetical protein
MTWQLRLYRVKDGELDEWVQEWRELVLPLRLARGFDVRGPWLSDDGRFVWMIGHDDFAAADAAYYELSERRAMEPDPARHLADTKTILLEDL